MRSSTLSIDTVKIFDGIKKINAKVRITFSFVAIQGLEWSGRDPSPLLWVPKRLCGDPGTNRSITESRKENDASRGPLQPKSPSPRPTDTRL